ncbi:MAG: tyrosine--tRNA ligase, partial [Proteobacteria bacterium]|nr:tyrosine--tRNA ligase [Pseudomonadota bacterium]
RQLQRAGHQPIILLGGGTTKVGDPSGKDSARQMLSEEQIQENLSSIRKTLEQFDLSKENPEKNYPEFIFVNNEDWLKDLKYIEFLQKFGRHFSINRMLTFDSVKLRLDREQPLSFLEFNYMILQAYDFYKLNADHNCVLQIGGSDQWGNIVNGVELTRRVNVMDTGLGDQMIMDASPVYGLTTPLLTTADGRKMGKTASGAVWLNKDMLDPFDYFQYLRNIDDKDVGRFLRFFTEKDPSAIEEIEKKEINQQKVELAYEATKICHGQEAAQAALDKAKELFSSRGNQDINALPEKEAILSEEEINSGKPLFAFLRDCGLCESGGEAKRLIKGGGVKINDQQVKDENYLVAKADLSETQDGQSYYLKVSLGKKKFFKVVIKLK